MLYKRCKGHDQTKCRHPFYYVFEVNAVRYSRSTKTANKQLAGRIEDRRRIAVLDGKDTEPTKPVMLKAHVADYVAHTKNHNSTAYKDQAILDRLITAVGDRPLKEVSAFGIEKWKKQRADDVSKSTVNRELNVIRGCFSRAVDWNRLPASPLRTVKNFKVDDRRVRVLTDDEIRGVLTCGDADVVLMCRMTLACLPRLSEVLGVHVSHIGPSWVEFRRKGGRVTRATITDELRDAMRARCHKKTGFVFPDQDGQPVTQQAASVRIVRVLRRLGIKDASHHTFRHTGVTLMLERGENPRAIQTLAGWTSLRQLERYGHVRDASMRRAVEGNAAHLRAIAESTTPPVSTKAVISS